ncbi:MAG TPA: tetratricopeptide repeat protein [Actinoplanes sp.]|nr:tetratricopeptide repeat protein [Actinoplanes sp.]
MGLTRSEQRKPIPRGYAAPVTAAGDVQAFGAILRRHRLLRRLTQEQLAEGSGVSIRTVSNLESGRVARPHRDTVGRLADALELSGAERAVFLISADVPYWGQRKASADDIKVLLTVPGQLPAAARPFCGRREELAALDAAAGDAEAAVRPILVTGAAGTGKTALVVRWAHNARHRFPEGQIFVNLRGYDPASPAQPADVLAGILQAFGVPNANVPRALDDRSALLRSLLVDRRALVILDNAATVEQVRPLLPGTGPAVVLVTSRNSLAGLVAREGAYRLDLAPLPARDAVDLLAALIAGELDERNLGVLADRCDRLPLALRIAAEAVGAGEGLSAVLAQLADDRQRLDVLDVPGDQRTSVRTVFSWSYGRLTSPVARAFRLLALHPGKDVDRPAAAALLDVDHHTAQRLLRHLAQAHLVEPDQRGRVQMHDLLKAYARERATGDRPGEIAAATTRLLEHYLGLARDGDPERLDEERANLVAACAHAAEEGWSRHVIDIADALWRYLDNGAHYPDALAIHTAAVDAAQRLGDRAGEALGEHHLAVVYWRWGENDEAWQHFVTALAAYRDAGESRGEAAILGNLGVLCWRWGRHPAARSYLEQAATLFRSLGSVAGEAGALGNQGLVAYRQGDYRSAIGLLHRSLALRRAVGDHAGEARTLDNLGEVCQRVGDFSEAEAFHEQALVLFRQVGDRYGEGRALSNRGAVHHHHGRLELALADLTEAYAIVDQIGDATGRGEVLLRLGTLHATTGPAQRAVTEGERALSIFEQVGDLNWMATALNNLGEAHRVLGQAETGGRRHWAARRIAAQAGDTYERARAHEGLAHALRHENPRSAMSHRHAAEAIYRHLGLSILPVTERSR